jgi:hypothetical protein
MTKDEHASHIGLSVPGSVGTEAGGRSMPEVSSRVAAGGGDGGSRAVAWSIRRAIELLDEAIDRMGSQLARAADFSMDWSDESPGSHLGRPNARSARRAVIDSSAPGLDPDADSVLSIRGPELP